MPTICIFNEDWERQSAEMIARSADFAVSSHGACNLFLTGGRSIQGVYRELSSYPVTVSGKVTFFFGDERCVPADHFDSNYRMACSMLFPAGVPSCVNVHRMAGESSNPKNEASRYEAAMPERIDMVLLVPGPDGHIASLFPDDPALSERDRLVVPVNNPSMGRRLTITPVVLTRTRQLFVLAKGAEKGKVLRRALLDTSPLPVRKAVGGVWAMDKEAGDAFGAEP